MSLFPSSVPRIAASTRLFANRARAMPLRARINAPNAVGVRKMSASIDLREQPGDEPDDVLFNSSYGVRTVELNRPKKLNSLNGSMARKILPRLLEWQKSDMANVVIMKGAGEKALCAGGDVAALALWNQEGPEGQRRSTDYFGLEYKLDHLIATYRKPYVAFMDGITMGGGVGLSVHAPFRIATERTVFAMPETNIGFFPEVGGSFFLPRLDGALGTYLALTSDRLKGVQAFYHGIATHYLHSSSLPDLENRLAELTFRDAASMDERLKLINSTIEEFVTGLPHDETMYLSGNLRRAIDDCFSRTDINEVLSKLAEYEAGNDKKLSEWASKTLKTIHQRSPTSIKVTLREMQLGKNWSISESFAREFAIAAHFMAHHDFVEGVSALLIRKPPETPQWQPAKLDEISREEVDRFFHIEGSERLQMVNEAADYKVYPHAWLGLPREQDVQPHITSGKSAAQTLEHFLHQYSGKIGVQYVVQEILDRKTQTNGSQTTWVD